LYLIDDERSDARRSVVDIFQKRSSLKPSSRKEIVLIDEEFDMGIFCVESERVLHISPRPCIDETHCTKKKVASAELLQAERKSLLQTNYFDDEKLENCNVPTRIVVRIAGFIFFFSFKSCLSKQVENTPKPTGVTERKSFSRKDLFANNSLNPDWEKRNSDEIEMIDAMLKDYEKNKTSDRLFNWLQEIRLIPTVAKKICRYCQKPCTNIFNFKLSQPIVKCSCGKLSIAVKESSFFKNIKRPIPDQLLLMKGFMSGETGYSLARSTDMKEPSIRKYLGQFSDRVDWLVEREMDTLQKTIFNNDKVEFLVTRRSIYFTKAQDEFFSVAGMIELYSKKSFFKVLIHEEDYINWIREIVPKNYFSSLYCIPFDSSESKLLQKIFPGIHFKLKMGTIDDDCDGTMKLDVLFWLIQDLFSGMSLGKNTIMLQRLINSVLFRANGLSSFLQLFNIDNEEKFQEYLRNHRASEENKAKVSRLSVNTFPSKNKNKISYEDEEGSEVEISDYAEPKVHFLSYLSSFSYSVDFLSYSVLYV
jgi:hypothetical protein